jgi:hypothetical protein
MQFNSPTCVCFFLPAVVAGYYVRALTSRLLRPAVLDPGLDARFANLAMNDATVYEQARLMDVFRRAHPKARFVMVGLDAPWCITGNRYQKLTPRPFLALMYGAICGQVTHTC